MPAGFAALIRVLRVELVFVLVGPKYPGNLGASARALKAMGFSALRLVNPCEFRTGSGRGEAYRMAMYSHEILDHAGVFSSLADAVADCDLVIGTTARMRHHRHSVLTPAQLKAQLLDKHALLTRAALVFGPEDTGLTNEHLDACQVLTTVPLAAPEPSINLAQAVMIYTHTLSDLPAEARYARANTDTSYSAAVGAIEQAARELGVEADERIVAWLRERVPLLPARDLRMLYNLLHVREKRGG